MMHKRKPCGRKPAYGKGYMVLGLFGVVLLLLSCLSLRFLIALAALTLIAIGIWLIKCV
jgi:hypothetical protein